MNVKGLVLDLKRLDWDGKISFLDWSDKVSSVIFLPGCNFRCPFCHVVRLVLAPEKLKTIPFEKVEAKLKENKEWIGAVSITGGEPTLQSSLPELCLKLKDMQFLVKLDTNGTNPVMLKGLRDRALVDYVAMEIKAPLTVEKYSVGTGVNAEHLLPNVKKSIRLLMTSDMDYEFRTTVVPTIHSIEDIKQICRDLKGCKRYVLQKFVTIGETVINPDFMLKSLSEEEMRKFVDAAQEVIPNARRRY